MPSIPPQDRPLDLLFPVKGLDVSQPFERQPPQTTPTGVNVRAFETLTQRMRGGSRPALSKYVAGQLPGGASLVQELNVVVGVGYTAPGPPMDLVQQGYGVGNATGSTLTDSLQVPATAGNSIVVFVGTIGNYVAVSDAVNGTYTKIINASLGSYSFAIYRAQNVLPVQTINIANPSNYTVNAITLEVLPTTGQETSGTGGSGTPGTIVIDNAWTTAHAPGLYFAGIQSGSSLSRTGGTGWTDLKSPSNTFALAVQHLSGNTTLGAVQWTMHTFDYSAGWYGGLEMSS